MYSFNTEDVTAAKAALLLYAMYRSRPSNSSMNGKETWSRCASFIRAAVLKSCNTAEFVHEFCHKAGVTSIKPSAIDTGEPVRLSDGSLASMDGLKDYHTELYADDEIRVKFGGESEYIIALVRERLQTERAFSSAPETEEEE